MDAAETCVRLTITITVSASRANWGIQGVEQVSRDSKLLQLKTPFDCAKLEI
jgi:hypothetical protein